MNKLKMIIGTIAMIGLLALSVAAQTPSQAATKPVKPPKASKATNTAPKSDGDIQADIQKRLAAAPKLKSENITVAVSNAVATFSGTVSNSGSKGGVSSLAKAAGAKKVVNNITVQKAAKAPKK